VLPDADEVGGGAEEEDGHERQARGAAAAGSGGRDVQLRGRRADPHGVCGLPLALLLPPPTWGVPLLKSVVYWA
jgi:hypothetical protein